MQKVLLMKIFFFTVFGIYSFNSLADGKLKTCDSSFSLLENPTACICVSKKIEVEAFGQTKKNISLVAKQACEQLKKNGLTNKMFTVSFGEDKFNFLVSDYKLEDELNPK